MSTVQDLPDFALPAGDAPPKFPAAPYDSAAAYFSAYAEETVRAASSVETTAVARAAEILLDAYTREATVFSCGNGGSASIANHLQCDHTKNVGKSTDLLPRVMSLSVNVEVLTAIANDHAYPGRLHAPVAIAVASRRRAGGRVLVGSFGQYRDRPALGARPRPPHDLADRIRRRRGQDHRRRVHSRRRHELRRDRGPASGDHARPGPVHPAVANDTGRDLLECVLNHGGQHRCDTKAGPSYASRPKDPYARGDQPLARESRQPLRGPLVLDPDHPRDGRRLEPGEELYLLVSPKSRHLHQGYGPDVRYITYPWSNERRTARTLSEHLYSPVRLPL